MTSIVKPILLASNQVTTDKTITIVTSSAYQTARDSLVALDASLCFAVVANSPFLSSSQQAMINATSSENLRYSKMALYGNNDTEFNSLLANGFSQADTSFNREIAVAKKFNQLTAAYIKEFKPDLGVSDQVSQILNKQFPTHNYFPAMKGDYESNEIFKVLDSFPKGGQLHVHSGALCDIDWVLREGKWSNTRDTISTNKIGLTYDLSGGNYGFFVNKKIIDGVKKYEPGSKTLFKAFPIRTIPGGSRNVRTFPATPPASGIKDTYNQTTRVYTKDNVEWLDLRNNDIGNTKMVLTESIRKSIRECLTMVGKGTNSLEKTDIPEVWSVFELVNSRWSSLRSAGSVDPSFNIDLFASGIRYAYDTKIQHIDIRLGFGFDDWSDTLSTAEKRDKVYATITDIINKMYAFTEALMKVQSDVASTGRDINDFNIRFILGTPRFASVLAVEYLLTAAYMLKTGKGYPYGEDLQTTTSFGTTHAAGWGWDKVKVTKSNGDIQTLAHLIIGYDLIAEEDRNNSTDFYRSSFLKTNIIEGKLGTSMDFYFHDGESNWRSNDNVVDAILLGTKRIGHGFNVDMRPGVVARLIRDNICLEICPISNQMLQYTPDIRGHYANGLYRQGVPMVISNDDPVMFGYTGLTYDFFAAVISWGLTYKDVKRLAWSSIHYSSLTTQQQISVKRKFGILIDGWVSKMVRNNRLVVTNRNSAEYQFLCM